MNVLATALKHMAEKRGAVNIHAVPTISRVVINVGVGKHKDDAQYVAAVEHDLAVICGQKPHVCRARQAVAGFSVRSGNIVGLRVTLRGKRMVDFISRFVGATLPRVRDFRGVSLSQFDGHGNLNVGLEEHMAFPEIRPEKTDVIFGLQVTFVTTAKDDQDALALFRALGFPLGGDDAA